MGQIGDKSVDKKIHDKVFEQKSSTRTAIPRAYQSVVERLTDSRCITCPLCHKEWSVIAENLSLESSDPKVRQTHLRTEHIDLWNVLQGLFGIGSDEIPDERVSTAPNPESCPDDEPGKLGKEELAERISSDEELRHQFFLKWMLKLQGKEE